MIKQATHLQEPQDLTMLWYSRRWQEFTHGLWIRPSARLATVSGVIGITSAAASAVAAVL
jgi:hypothetical protein